MLQCSGTECALSQKDSTPQRLCQMAVGTREQISYSHGPTVFDDGTTFRVWAPERASVELVFVDSNGQQKRKLPLNRDSDGFFSTHVAELADGALYYYQLD